MLFYKFAKCLRKPFFTEHLRWLLLFLKKKSKNEKISLHKYIHRKTPVIVSLQLQAWGLKTVVGLRDYSFTKDGLHLRCFFVKFVQFYRISFLQKTAGRLLPISSNISDISLALLAINQLRYSLRLSKKFTKSCSQAIHCACLKNI